MKHVHNDINWFYELRPTMIAAFGLFGILSQFFVGSNTLGLTVTSQVSGAVLLFASYKIFQWRHAYRKNLM